jgi:hypothetical protein
MGLAARHAQPDSGLIQGRPKHRAGLYEIAVEVQTAIWPVQSTVKLRLECAWLGSPLPSRTRIVCRIESLSIEELPHFEHLLFGVRLERFAHESRGHPEML